MAQTLFDLLGDPEAAVFAPPFAKDLRKKPKNIDVLNAGIAGIGDLAYDVAGFPVDISTALMRALGAQTGQTPFGSDWLKQRATNAGIRPPESADPTLRDVRLGAEIMAGGIDPFATARGIGVAGSKVAKELEPTLFNALDTYAQKAGLQPSILPPDAAKKVMGQTKIVDESGAPKLLYRGSRMEKGAPLEWSEARQGQTGKGKDTGQWFSDNPTVATSYAGSRGQEGYVAPAYLDMRNPLIVDAGGNTWGEIPKTALGDLGNRVSKEVLTTDEIARIAKSQGYDGVEFRNVLDAGPAGSGVDLYRPSSVYVSFNPKAARSALSDKAIAGAARVPPRPKAPAQQAVQAPTIEAPVSPVGFYSAAEQAALNLTKTKGTGQSLIDELMKAPNVKKDELEYTGLIDAFADKKQATKQELIDYLRENRTNVGEKRLGDQPTRWEGNTLFVDNEPVGSIRDTSAGFAWRTPDGKYEILGGRMFDAVEKVERRLGISVPEQATPKYGKYTLPGGENYREVLLTLPTKTPLDSKTYGVGYTEGSVVRFNTRAEAEAYNQQMYKGKANIFEQDRAGDLSSYNNQADYTSPHWSEPNVFAHLRLNDRIDADGKKMTLIEEVQSDWHQAGREKGYGPKMETSVEAYYETKSGQRVPIGFGKTKEEAEASIDVGWKNMVDIKYDTIERKVGDGVPDAPMKETWYQTALRKAVKDAIDQGSDRVGILTGARQAERYDLSKQVDEIAVPMIKDDGSRSVRIDPTQGPSIKLMVDKNGVVTGYGSGSTQFSGKKLDEVIGKEMADKVMKADAETRFSDVDLQVGGEGMKKYYDEMYPKYLDKFAKKYGSSVKEGKINLDKDLEGFMPRKDMRVEKVQYIEITPEMRKAFGGKDKGVPLFQMAPAIPAGAIGAGGLLDQFGEREQ